MRVSIDAVRETGKLREAAICYTGDITDPSRTKYNLGYYVKLAKELESAGTHILGIKVPDRSLAASVQTRRQADEEHAGQVGAPMPGMIVAVAVTVGQAVKQGDRLFTIEAMKMETAVPSPVTGVVDEIDAGVGARVETRDLVMTVHQAANG